MGELQQRSTGNGGTVSKRDRKNARYLADAVLISKECEALDAFRIKAEGIALSYKIPAVIMPFSAKSEARRLSVECGSKNEREILAASVDEVAGIYDKGSRESRFLQDVAAEIRNSEARF